MEGEDGCQFKVDLQVAERHILGPAQILVLLHELLLQLGQNTRIELIVGRVYLLLASFFVSKGKGTNDLFDDFVC